MPPTPALSQYDMGGGSITFNGDVDTRIYYRCVLFTVGGAVHWETTTQTGQAWNSHRIEGGSGDQIPLVRITPPPDVTITWLSDVWFETLQSATVNFKLQAGLADQQIDDHDETTLD